MEKLPFETKEVFGYGRVSSRDQEREGNSLPAQRKSIFDYARKYALRIIKYFQDTETAKQAGRTEFEKLIKELMSVEEENRVVLVEKVDRLARNFEDVVTLKALNATLVFVKTGLIINKNSRSSDYFHYGVDVVMSEYYLRNLSEEVKKGLNAKAESGWYPGNAMIGYRNAVLDSGRHVIEPDQTTAPLIKRLFELFATGDYSLQRLGREARSLGLCGRRSKRPLGKEQLRRILTNEIYYGAFRWQGVLYQGKHQPIIEKSLFDRVQVVLRRGDRPRKEKVFIAFRGLLRCKVCGCLITGERHVKKNGKTYIHYHCSHTKFAEGKQPTRCATGYWPEERLVETIGGQVIRPLTFPLEVLTFCRQSLADTQKDEEKYTGERILDLRRKLGQLQRYQDLSYKDKLDGTLDEDDWRAKYNEWKKMEFDYKAEIQRLEGEEFSPNVGALKILELTQDIEAIYLTLPIDKKAELLRIVSSNSELDNVTIWPIYRKPFDLLAKGLTLENWRGRRDSNSRPHA